ncbi:MAG: TonB family protein [Crocinitomicaceae bacterium]|jgi:TonB family protein
MKLKIKEPCHEDWNKMNPNDYQIGLHTRHCDSCEKSVMDFTQNTRAEIIAFMLSNQDKSVCGRMRPDQFDFRHEDVPMLITTMQRQKTANPFLILSLVCMSLSAYGQEEIKHIETPPAVEQHYKVGKMVAQPQELEELGDMEVDIIEITTKGEMIALPPDTRQGDIALVPGTESTETCSSQRIYQFAEKMPEFCGGLSAMTKYFSENVYYTSKSKVQGTVYVRFVVDVDGSIKQSEILRGIADPKLNEEALRVVSEMPDWNPGEQRGEGVPVYMTVPVRFVY